jgi:hypothetical protein
LGRTDFGTDGLSLVGRGYFWDGRANFGKDGRIWK